MQLSQMQKYKKTMKFHKFRENKSINIVYTMCLIKNTTKKIVQIRKNS